MDYWIEQGCREFVLSIGYRAEKIADHFGNAYKGCSLRYAIEKEPLGTGGAIFSIVGQLDEKIHPRVLVMNGDTLFAADLAAIEKFHADAAADTTLALLPAGSEARYGRVETDTRGKILAFGENGTRGQWINAGLYLMNVAWAREQASCHAGPCSIERDVFPAWLLEGHRIFGWRAEAPFLDIGIPESYAKTGDFLRQIQIHGKQKQA